MRAMRGSAVRRGEARHSAVKAQNASKADDTQSTMPLEM